ncbi:MBL fold metallo-hydrolase [Reichenbachiella sp. MALMAid0571]|uniref:MBL fold metallo-hydrolase n=1 Tax=Reichenbachiella sp. MALMAid0571 TaxID=3143939 RepID=UPI0032DFA518
MKITIRVLKMISIFILGIVALLVIVGVLFVNISPQFGGKPTREQKAIYQQSKHYVKDKFVNEVPTPMDMRMSQYVSLIGKYFSGVPNQAPQNPLPVQKIDSLDIVNHPDTLTRVTWFGHSAFLLEIQGQNILLDPMFGDAPAPHPWLGKKRFSNGLPIEIEKLPKIDAVIFSHDHYDHLDYGSIMKLKDKVKKFYVPLGLGAHLIEWGVAAENIHELNWWDEIKHEGLVFACTPARHFSGRGLGDRFSTLWASWAILGTSQKIYFSGDSGYNDHFKAIGEKYGPFDFAMMECGQYNELWHNIHMMPEETAQAAVDVKAKLMMPIHWGSFVLALHTWQDPVERVFKKATDLNQPIVIPQIGNPIVLEKNELPDSDWWRGLK